MYYSYDIVQLNSPFKDLRNAGYFRTAILIYVPPPFYIIIISMIRSCSTLICAPRVLEQAIQKL